MKKDINYLEIEHYLTGELKGKQLLNFEKRLKEDSIFANEVALYKEVNNTLENRFSNYKEENKLRNTLEDLGTFHIKNNAKTPLIENPNKKEVKVFSLKKYSKYLAAASIVFIASLLWINSNKEINYSDFATHELIELTVRGDNNLHKLAAQKAFNNKNFAQAQKEFEILLNKDATKIELQLYLAICLIEQGKFELADSILTKISKGDSVYKNKAIWNLALSKLKQKKYKAVKKVLKKLPKEADQYYKAQKLLNKL